MTENNKKQFDAHVALAKQIAGRELTDKEIEALKLKFDNPIAKEIDFRPGETDLTHLKQSEINQLILRNQSDTLAYLKFINETLNNIYLGFMCYFKENLKVDSFDELEKFKDNEYKKFKGE